MDFNARMLAFIESVKAKAKDGLSLEEAFSILHDFIEMAVEAAAELGNSGSEKRALVLQWVGTLFDVVAPLVPVPMWYRLLQPITRPIVRQIVLAVAGAILEKTYAKLKAS